MIRKYTFYYGFSEAEVSFKVDTNKFKTSDAKELLDFFSWRYDEEADPIDELMKKYALVAIKHSARHSENGIKHWFKVSEGFVAVDGSMGIEFSLGYGYEFDEDFLEMTIEESNE